MQTSKQYKFPLIFPHYFSDVQVIFTCAEMIRLGFQRLLCSVHTFIGASALDDVEKNANMTEEETQEALQTQAVPLDYRRGIHRNSIARDTMSYMIETGRRPQNHMINSARVVITHVLGEDGNLKSLSPPIECTRREGIKMAQDAGLDLIQDGKNYKSKVPIPTCTISDGVCDALVGVAMQHQRPSTRKTKVPFITTLRGGCTDWMMKVKATQIGRKLFKRHAVRIELTRYGTAREGIPVLEHLLFFVKLECERLKNSGHVVGPIHTSAKDQMIHVWLFPPSDRMKIDPEAVTHPSKKELELTTNKRLQEAQEELLAPFNRHNEEFRLSTREMGQYEKALEEGKAWAWWDEGLSLKQQRAEKVRGGWLPKSNKHYALRCDVDTPKNGGRYSVRSQTGVDAALAPQKLSNVEQAERGIATIAKRAKMRISDMHDLDETEANETKLTSFHYRMGGGDAYTGRDFKHTIGLIDKNRKVPSISEQFGDGVRAAQLHDLDIQRDQP